MKQQPLTLICTSNRHMDKNPWVTTACLTDLKVLPFILHLSIWCYLSLHSPPPPSSAWSDSVLSQHYSDPPPPWSLLLVWSLVLFLFSCWVNPSLPQRALNLHCHRFNTWTCSILVWKLKTKIIITTTATVEEKCYVENVNLSTGLRPSCGTYLYIYVVLYHSCDAFNTSLKTIRTHTSVHLCSSAQLQLHHPHL